MKWRLRFLAARFWQVGVLFVRSLCLLVAVCLAANWVAGGMVSAGLCDHWVARLLVCEVVMFSYCGWVIWFVFDFCLGWSLWLV